MGMNETFKAISDPVRRDILQMLKRGKKSAGEIAEQFNLTGATVSYHLSKLKSADLIVEEKYKLIEEAQKMAEVVNQKIQQNKVEKQKITSGTGSNKIETEEVDINFFN